MHRCTLSFAALSKLITKHIKQISENLIHENNFIQEISKQYIQYIQNLNHNKKSSSKNFYIIVKEKNENKEIIDYEDYAIENLNDKICLKKTVNLRE